MNRSLLTLLPFLFIICNAGCDVTADIILDEEDDSYSDNFDSSSREEELDSNTRQEPDDSASSEVPSTEQEPDDETDDEYRTDSDSKEVDTTTPTESTKDTDTIYTDTDFDTASGSESDTASEDTSSEADSDNQTATDSETSDVDSDSDTETEIDTTPVSVVFDDLDGICSYDGIIEHKNDGYDGIGYFNTDNEIDQSLEWSIHVKGDQMATLKWKYSIGNADETRPAVLLINSNKVDTISFTSTSDWSIWDTLRKKVSLTTGNNRVQLVSLDDLGLPNLDTLTIFGYGVSAGACE
ncbi:MAG: hypothetical protein JXR76_11090 [Deltaproteobacteria bacterium]|nr:hypothetical protein [Deltaproteobacteria bacterium]